MPTPGREISRQQDEMLELNMGAIFTSWLFKLSTGFQYMGHAIEFILWATVGLVVAY